MERACAMYAQVRDVALYTSAAREATLTLRDAACKCRMDPPLDHRFIDLHANAGLAGHDIAFAIRRNESLTSIDIRGIPSANIDSVYTAFGTLLLQDDCQCRLGFLSCDAFRVQVAYSDPHSVKS